MQDPSKYEALYENIHRLLSDAELLLQAGRYASANALAILAIEEAGKYTSLVSATNQGQVKRSHKAHQGAIAKYFTSAATFEVFAREADGLLEHLRMTNSENYAQLSAMPRHELIRFAIASMASDPTFDIQRFVKRVVGEDDSINFADDVRADKYHEERLESNYVDYDANGELVRNPFDIGPEQAERSVELAWFAAKLQSLWKTSWERRSQGGQA